MFFTSKPFYILLVLALILGSNYVVEMIGRWHYTTNGSKDLFDLGHYFLPNLQYQRWMFNFLPLVFLIYTYMLPNSTAMFKEFIVFFMMILAIRALTTLSTILPKEESCTETSFLHLMIEGGCYDKIFSGHTSLVALLTLILLDYKHISFGTFLVLNGAQALSLLLTRAHYTADVILGFVITYLVYDGDYHIFSDFLKGIGSGTGAGAGGRRISFV